MKKLLSILLVTTFLFPILPKAMQSQDHDPCSTGSKIWLPVILKAQEAHMATKTANEWIEKTTHTTAEVAYDGIVKNVFPESVNVQLAGSRKVVPADANPDIIEHIKAGMPVKLGKLQGKYFVLQYFPQWEGEDDINYASIGTRIPAAPAITVLATRDGWLVSWQAVAGADRYCVYRNDTQDGTTPDEVGETTATSMIIGYESPFIYFAVRAISGLHESELSYWVTDNQGPPVPNTFAALNAVGGHNLMIFGDDVSLTDPGFKCWEIEVADDDQGTGATSLGYFYPVDLPSLQIFGPGTVRYYRIRSIDWAGNASDWTDWDDAWVLEGTIKDLFDGYGGDQISALESLWWLRIATLDSDEPWEPITSSTGTISDDTTYDKEGDGAKRITAELYFGTYYANIKLAKPIDLSNEGRFTNDDYVTITGYASFTGSPVARVDFFDNTSGGRFLGPTLYPTNGRNYIQIKKSEFTASGSPDWADISHLYLIFEGMSSASDYMVWDDFRIVKADPDDATTYNDTGLAWDYAASTGSDVGEWHIYEGNRSGEPPKPFSYGQIKTDSPSVWYMSHKPLTTTDIREGTIQAGVYLKDSDGQAGLAFFVKDVTADSWDMYVIEADSSADTITLAKYVSGTRTQIAQASFTFAPDQILWLGADFRDYDSDGGRIRVYASLNEGNLIQATNMVLSEQDTEWISDPGGSVGLLSYQANVRFVNFVAGSPAHAEVADVARALDGPIITGEQSRLWLRDNAGALEKSTDGSSWELVISSAAKWADARSKVVLAGGGNISWDGSTVSWTSRFIWIPFDLDLAIYGYFETPYSGSQSLSYWQGLYYAPPVGGGHPTSGSLQVYTFNVDNIPPNALLICYRHADTIDSLIFANGQRLRPGQSIPNGLGAANWQVEREGIWRTSDYNLGQGAWQTITYQAAQINLNKPSGAIGWDGGTAIYTWGPGQYIVLSQIYLYTYGSAYANTFSFRIVQNGSVIHPGRTHQPWSIKNGTWLDQVVATPWISSGLNGNYFQTQIHVAASDYTVYAYYTTMDVIRLPA